MALAVADASVVDGAVGDSAAVGVSDLDGGAATLPVVAVAAPSSASPLEVDVFEVDEVAVEGFVGAAGVLHPAMERISPSASQCQRDRSGSMSDSSSSGRDAFRNGVDRNRIER